MFTVNYKHINLPKSTKTTNFTSSKHKDWGKIEVMCPPVYQIGAPAL